MKFYQIELFNNADELQTDPNIISSALSELVIDFFVANNERGLFRVWTEYDDETEAYIVHHETVEIRELEKLIEELISEKNFFDIKSYATCRALMIRHDSSIFLRAKYEDKLKKEGFSWGSVKYLDISNLLIDSDYFDGLT